MKRARWQDRIIKAQGISLLLCLFLLMGLSGCAKREIENVDSKGTNIICFGDSLTFGYGANPQDAYPLVLLEISTRPVINAGIDGDTTTEALARLDTDVLERSPLLVVIEFGGNDFLRKVPLETSMANIAQMIDRIHEKGAMVALVDISAGMFLAEYHGALEKLAREKGVIFIPEILSGIITNPSMKSDFLHPNKNGYRMIAQRIYREIEPYLKENQLILKGEKR
ncbi:MAG: GDSL-type esterase/lipase family protein [Candidatus Omnitrophica bacterium]|nr:GDSL-type esterase/lipase family protein [Candidatus Omnitrophota bacterium]MDD5652541.1 GDSL-type esterase/lipase family protein [Candidatus Omnitrophota bacterium]